MNFDKDMFSSGLGGVVGGLFGDSGKPYDDAMKQYREWMGKAQGTQQPFLDAGTGAIGDYQDWLKGQKDPSGFMNNLMGQYQESPYAKYLQQQAMNAGNNSASASGMMGSSALMQQQQQNAGNIASQDMNQWLQHVLGINTQYGQGQDRLMTGGQNAANSLSNMYNQMGERMGNASFGKTAREQKDRNDMWGGLANMGLSFLPVPHL